MHTFRYIWRHQRAALLLVGLLLLQSCEDAGRRVETQQQLVSFLDALSRQYEEACQAMGEANWNNYSKEGPADLNGAKEAFARLFTDPESAQVIDRWRSQIDSDTDPQLARRLEMWHRCFLGGKIDNNAEIAHLENALEKRITDFSFEMNGESVTRATLQETLEQSDDREERHRAWATTAQLSSAMAGDLQRLVELRNAFAQSLGYPNYYSLTLTLQAVNEEWLFLMLGELEKMTREPFRQLLQEWAWVLNVEELRAWDLLRAREESAELPDRYFPKEEVFQVLHRFEKAIGFPVEELPIREVVKDLPYGGLSLAIHIPNDSRFLVNPSTGHNFYRTAFHEYGHSLQAVYTRSADPILKGYEWIPGAQSAAYAEGLAEIHGEFTRNEAWLEEYVGIGDPPLSAYVQDRWKLLLYRLRRLMRDTFLEYEMYRNPQQDVAALERRMYTKYLLIEYGEGEPHRYAASAWYTAYPCYYQNYILASMIASQVHGALSREFGESMINNPAVAEWLVENLYADGELLEWTDRIERATGRPLSDADYLRALLPTEENPM